MGSTPKPPKVQSSSETAQNQQMYTNQSQIASGVNQSNPYGNLNYTYSIGPDGQLIMNANQSLSPAQQQLLNTLQGTQQTAGTQGGQLLAGANYGEQP